MSDQALSHSIAAASVRERSASPPATPASQPSLDVWAMAIAGIVFVVLVFAGVIPPAWQ